MHFQTPIVVWVSSAALVLFCPVCVGVDRVLSFFLDLLSSCAPFRAQFWCQLTNVELIWLNGIWVRYLHDLSCVKRRVGDAGQVTRASRRLLHFFIPPQPCHLT